MMLAYVDTHSHPIVKLPIDEFLPQLKVKVWGSWSPMDVIEHMDMKKYKADVERIKNAKLSYPIMLTGKHTIVDGYHRLAKAYLEKKKHIHAYIFETELMNKFIINKDMDFVKVHQHTDVNEILELWTKRFCK
jgi:hypothetical protein